MAYEIFIWAIEKRDLEVNKLPELSQEEVEEIVKTSKRDLGIRRFELKAHMLGVFSPFQ